MINLVVDCMGSDNGPIEISKGILEFLKNHDDVIIHAVGKIEELSILENNPKIQLVDAREVAPMTIGALEVMRKRETSLYKAVTLTKDNNYDGVVSAGSTGGFLSCSTIRFKLIEGIQRAALVSPFPTKNGNPTAILDIGASNENTGEQLYQFALMGKVYYQVVFNKPNPSIYLLSNGTEDEKGSPEIKEAHKLLVERKFEGFKGNCEARDALDGNHDVIVSGGFAGNVFLKASEGMAKMLSSMIKKAFKKSLLTKIGYLFSFKGFKEMKNTMNYEKYGGAMLLGVNKVVVKAHGSSNSYSFSCALELAYSLAKNNVVSMIEKGVLDCVRD